MTRYTWAMTQKALLVKFAEEALNQPNPTTGLKRALLDYRYYQTLKAIREKSLAAARQRKHRAQKPDPYLERLSQTSERCMGSHN